jgi:1,4-alpha-glucan branching enzyme
MEEVLNHRWQWEQKDICRTIGGFRDLGFSTATQVVNYTCSHDEVRPEHEIKFYSAPFLERPQGMSVQRAALALALCGLVAVFAAPGIPMIYAGQEFGEDSPRTIDFLPMQWSKLQRDEHAAQYAAVRRLIRARRSHPALRSDHIQFYTTDFAHDKTVRFHRWDGAGDEAVCAINFGHERRTLELYFPANGRWRDVVHNRYRNVEKRGLTVELQPYDAVLFLPVST